MSKPELPKWIPSDDVTKITDPGTTKRAFGWIYKEKPPYQFVNWLYNLISKWLLGLQGGYFDIVIGSSTQVTDNEATNVLADLDDTLAVNGSRILFLDGTHTLTGNLSLSKTDLKVIAESPLAILDVATFTASFLGVRNFIQLRVTNAGAADVIVSGTGSIFEGINTALTSIAVSNGAVARTSGTGSGIDYKTILQDGGALVDLITAQTYSAQKNFSTATLADGVNISWDLDSAQVAKVTLAGNRTLDDPTNMVDGGVYVLRVIQDGSPPRTLVYGAAYVWSNGVEPTLSSASGGVDILTFNSDGVKMYGTHSVEPKQDYVSPAQTITTAGNLTLPHGLPSTPYKHAVVLKCLAAEHGFSIGDEIIMAPSWYLGNGPASSGAAMNVDATNLNIRFVNIANVYSYANKATGVIAALTNASWSVTFRAWL